MSTENSSYKPIKGQPYSSSNYRFNPLGIPPNKESKPENYIENIIQEKKEDINKINNDDIMCSFSSNQSATNDECYEYICSWNGKLYFTNENNDEIIIAKCKFNIIQYTRIQDNIGDIADLFDEHSQEIYDLLEIMNVKEDWPFCDNLFPSQFMNENCVDKIIYLDRIQLINGKYKGFGYGKCLIQRIIDNFGTSQTRVICKPFPLQWENNKENPRKKDDKQFAIDMQKVINVYEAMNFRKIGNSQFYGRNEALIQPKMKEFCKFLQDNN